MTFHLTEDQATIQQLAREFAQSELAPIAAQIDQEERNPRRSSRRWRRSASPP